MKISLLHPSRGRAQKAFDTLKFWLDSAEHPKNIKHILSLDADDAALGQYLLIFKDSVNTTVIIGPNKNVVQATNAAAEKCDGEVLIYLSDDFKCPKNWDSEMFELASLYAPALMKVNDCLQPFDVPVLTIPIMNDVLYQKLGYFWNPEYASMFCDEDLYWTCKKHFTILERPDLLFPHEHCSIGKAERDETYIRSESNWDSGKAIYARRKMEGFPL